MEIEFTTKKMQKACSSEKEMRREWGDQMARKLMQRLAELRAAVTLEDMRRLPGRCHELKHDRAGQLAVHLIQPRRLIFRPNHDPVPTKPEGGLDWPQVARIVVLEVVDYHG